MPSLTDTTSQKKHAWDWQIFLPQLLLPTSTSQRSKHVEGNVTSPCGLLIARLLDSVAPDVKTISFGCAFISFAMLDLAKSFCRNLQ